MKTILTAAAAMLALAAAPAAAQQAAPSQLVISYGDLDLSTERGVRTLDRRIRSAVGIACGPTSDADPAGTNDVRQCRTETLALARAQRDVAIAAATGETRIALAARR